MRRFLFLIIAFLVVSVPASADDRLAWGGSMMMLGGGAGASCASGTADPGADYIDVGNRTGSSQASNTNAKGQSFQVSSSGNLYSISFRFESFGGATTATCRVGTSANLSTYLAESPSTNIGSTNGNYEFVFSGTAPALSSGTTYYAGCLAGAASPAFYFSINTANGYASGTFYTAGTGWAMSASAANDALFQVKLCN